MVQNNDTSVPKKRMYRGVKKDDPDGIEVHFEVENDDDPIFDTLSDYFEVEPIQDGERYFMGTRISDQVQHIFVAESEEDPKYQKYDPSTIREILDKYELDQYEDWDFEEQEEE